MNPWPSPRDIIIEDLVGEGRVISNQGGDCMQRIVLDASTCLEGEEQYEAFLVRASVYYHYDYRAPDGVLFSTIAPTLEECRKRKKEWFIHHGHKIYSERRLAHMLIRVREKGVDIITDDEREFSMNYVQMKQIQIAIDIIQTIDETVDARTIRIETAPIKISTHKED